MAKIKLCIKCKNNTSILIFLKLLSSDYCVLCTHSIYSVRLTCDSKMSMLYLLLIVLLGLVVVPTAESLGAKENVGLAIFGGKSNIGVYFTGFCLLSPEIYMVSFCACIDFFLIFVVLQGLKCLIMTIFRTTHPSIF